MSLQHIFMLMLENRSFDHMLGFSMINGRDAQTGQLTQVNGLMGNESKVFNGSTYLNEYRSSTSQHPLTDVTLGDLRAALAAFEVANHEVAAAWGGLLPALSVDYLYGIDSNQFAIRTDGLRNVGYSAVATLQIPIFSWGSGC
jgi:hypothetical protein